MYQRQSAPRVIELRQKAAEKAVPVGTDCDSKGQQTDLEEAGLPPFHCEILE